MDAIDILRKQQAQNRSNFAERKVEVSPALYRSIGFDAETGMQIVSNGSDTVSASRNTNGAIKPNQPVKTTQAGSRAVVDSMPSPKTRKSTTATQRGKVKVLFTTYQGGIDSSDGTISLWVGGWRGNPVKIAEYPNNQSRFTNIISPSINNLGGDKWIASWEFITRNTRNSQQIIEHDWITRSNSGTWRFSELDVAEDLRLDTLVIEHHGFGYWTFTAFNPPVSNIEIDRIQSSQTGITGYWIKDETATQPWSSQSSGINVGTSLRESTSSSEQSIAFYPGRFETLRTATRQKITNSPFTREEYSAWDQATVFLISDRLNQSLVKRRKGWNLSNTNESTVVQNYQDPVSGYWRFGEEDQQLQEFDPFQIDYALIELQQLAASHANWIGQKLFVCSEIPQQFRSGSKVRVTSKEFGLDESDYQTPLTKQIRSFKESVFPLKPGANILAVSYHPS